MLKLVYTKLFGHPGRDLRRFENFHRTVNSSQMHMPLKKKNFQNAVIHVKFSV
jgi:hypothetical protein